LFKNKANLGLTSLDPVYLCIIFEQQAILIINKAE